MVELRADVSVRHDEVAIRVRSAACRLRNAVWTLGFGLWTLDQRIPQSERCSDGAAGVAGRGGEIHFLEGRLQIDLSVSHRVHGAAASKSQIRTLIFLVKRIEHGEERRPV